MFSQTSTRFPFLSQLLLTILGLLFAMPLILLFKVSFQGQGIGNYIAVLSLPQLPRFFLNSIIVAACTIGIVYVVAMLAGYAFSKLEMHGKSVLFNAILVGLMLPATAVIVPLFLGVKTFQLFDNYLALIIPYSAFAMPFTLLLVRNFLDSIPNECIEASRIDGCNSFTTLLWIILPLSRAISVVVVVWTFLGAWNEYFLALVFMRDPAMQMITQAPQFFVGVYSQDTGKIFAALVLISLPVMVLYLLLQKYFENGMISGSVK
jgi:raffinose/stachyose/melibiose transport system permease protein